MPPFWRRAAAAPPPPLPPVSYDVLVALGPGVLPDGVDVAAAIGPVRRAVAALDGVGWVNVEHHPTATAETWLEVFPAMSAAIIDADAVAGIRAKVAVRVRQTLATLQPAPAPAATPADTWRTREFQPPAMHQPVWGFSDGEGHKRVIPAVARQSRPATDAGMLARLLAFVVPADAAEVAARAAIGQFGSFPAVLAAPEIELRTIRGLGPHSLAAIKLVHTAAVRLAKARIADRPVLDNWDPLMAYLNTVLARERVEQFRILFLDDRKRLLADEAQARGTVNHTPVYPREVVRRALELRAAALILVHNHPSGDPNPSGADLEMTAQIQAAASVVSVQIADHVIVGNGRWLSFRQQGLL